MPPARDLWLVGTGTGLGPYLAMLRHGGVLQRFEHVTLVHGVRSADAFGYREELETLEKTRKAAAPKPKKEKTANKTAKPEKPAKAEKKAKAPKK